MSTNRLSFFIFVLVISIAAQSDAQLEITSYSIDGGGGRSIGGSFELEWVLILPLDLMGLRCQSTSGNQTTSTDPVL